MTKNLDLALLEEAARWASRRAEGGAGAEDEAAFAHWLSGPAHADALEAVDVALLSLADAASAPELIAMRGAALENARRSGAARWMSAATSKARHFLLVAAAMLVLIVGAAATWTLLPASYATGIGERQVVTLKDGSRVSLDAATQVQTRISDSRREIWLERGRAKFDVAHDPLKPFTVTAADKTIVATGTSFSVELVNNQMRVVLYEGSVDVLDGSRTAAAGLAARKLTPGQEMIARIGAAREATTVAVDPARSRLWEGGQLVFDDEPMAVAIARVNRYAKSPIKLKSKRVGELRVSGVFNAGDTDAFLDGIAALLPLRVERNGGEIVLDDDAASGSSRRPGANP